MKKIVYLLFFISCNISAQNVISVSFQPIDMGMGLRYDREFKTLGVYVSQSLGQYRAEDLYINNHQKTALGITVPLSEGRLSIGINRHSYGDNNIEDKRVLNPYSAEIGGSTRINKINIGIRIDMIKGEGCIDIGIAL